MVSWGCGRRKGHGFPGYAFVSNAGGRSVAVVDLTRFAIARRIPLPGAPGPILAHPNRRSALVLLPETGLICEIDAASQAISGKQQLGPALGMRLSEDGKSLWILQPRSLVRLDTTQLHPAQTIRLPGTATDFDLSEDSRGAIVFGADRQMALVRLDSGAFEHRVTLSWEPSMVLFQANGKQVLAASQSDRSVSIFDVVTGRMVVRLPLPVAPLHFCFNSDGGQLFVTGPGMDSVTIVFPYQTEIGETILAGHAPDAMAVSAVPSYLFVTNPESGSITVLDVDTRKLVATVSVGQEPRSVLITPDNQYALVLNRRSGDMAVIWIAAFTARRHRTDPPPLFTMVPVGEGPVSAAIVQV
ncbi:MAG: YncE family protein [Bryobacteraceae bacterium]